MEQGNFVKVKEGAVTTVFSDQSGIRARYLEKDLASYNRIGLVAKVKDQNPLGEPIVCLSFGTEVCWFKQADLIKQ